MRIGRDGVGRGAGTSLDRPLGPGTPLTHLGPYTLIVALGKIVRESTVNVYPDAAKDLGTHL